MDAGSSACSCWQQRMAPSLFYLQVQTSPLGQDQTHACSRELDWRRHKGSASHPSFQPVLGW